MTLSNLCFPKYATSHKHSKSKQNVSVKMLVGGNNLLRALTIGTVRNGGACKLVWGLI